MVTKIQNLSSVSLTKDRLSKSRFYDQILNINIPTPVLL